MSGSDDGLDRSEMTDSSTRTLDTRPSGQRSNSSVHVCWHRATSVAVDVIPAQVRTVRACVPHCRTRAALPRR